MSVKTSKFINLPRIVDESIRLTLISINHNISNHLLKMYYGETYKKELNKPTLLFIFISRLNDMRMRIDQLRNSETRLETYGGKMVRNSKYDYCEKVIAFYQDFTNKMSDFIKQHKVTTIEGIALAVECKCCEKYVNLHVIKDFIDYPSYCKIQKLIDEKNCQMKIVRYKKAKRKFGKCKTHIETLQYQLF
ncbi:hypothetical protein WAF17_16605 [Bernardetia sp. ABR2-2B]|uniref:hypothetical protein n=1 Tax=Bernardetia sp. ABR2-2B TaxID=3127472 RepID=UPI0030D5DAFA